MISLTWKLKYNKCTYLPNKKTQNRFVVAKGEGSRGGKNWEF